MTFVYKNIGLISKTFRGVEFKPGEAKEVNDYINDRNFIRLDKLPAPASTDKAEKKSNKPEKAEPVTTPEQSTNNKSEDNASEKNKEDKK